MPDVVFTCEHVDGCGHMMEYELVVFRDEEEVMEKIDKEVGDTEIHESILEGGIGCIEPPRNTEKVISGEGTRDGTVHQGHGAACSLETRFVPPSRKQGEEPNCIDGDEEGDAREKGKILQERVHSEMIQFTLKQQKQQQKKKRILHLQKNILSALARFAFPA
ncbi:hypothetical protein L7F22_014474 [Adiantum nelumboides]|nr:hypothetical protein [Adiantum nelumboides]